MNKKFMVLLLFIAVVTTLLLADVGDYLSLDYFNQQREFIERWQSERPVMTALIFALIYILVTALSLPGAAVLTLISGALFGLLWGLVIASVASTVGATLAFLIARSVLRDWVQSKFSTHLSAINEGIKKDGEFYLLTLRLVPVFPFFIINLVMALTPIKVTTFYWVSQVGMLAGTAVYVNAGTQLAQIDSPAGIISPQMILSFVLLGLLPWTAKALVGWLKQRRALAKFNRPASFDNNLLVIGAGAAGLVSSYIAATVRAKVTLIEKHKMGGDCLNTGCIPSKALIRSARINRYLDRAQAFGLAKVADRHVDFAAVMARVQAVIAKVEPHDSVQRYTELGVNCLPGEATIVSPWEVEVNGKRISARHIIVASGGRPMIPDIPGLETMGYVDSDSLWQIQALPERLLVMGGGPIGCELAQAFSRLGSRVTMVVRSGLLPKEDDDVSAVVVERFRSEGIEVLERCHVEAFNMLNGDKTCDAILMAAPNTNAGDKRISRVFDQLLVATGRCANTENLGFEVVGVQRNSNGTVAVDEFMRTSCPTIFACGDVAGPYQFTHVASHQAWYASVNALFGSVKRFKVDYTVIPWVTFTDPEVARVGLSERDAKAKHIAYELTRYGLDDLDRAMADSEDHGFIKVLTKPGSDKILGVTIVGYHASELIAEYILAMKHGLGLNKILSTIHIYPTFSEANKYIAGEWKKARKPENLLVWVEKFHAWRR